MFLNVLTSYGFKHIIIMVIHFHNNLFWKLKSLALHCRLFLLFISRHTCQRGHIMAHTDMLLKGPYTCFNVQKGLSHTACAAEPLFTLCLKPEPSLLKLQKHKQTENLLCGISLLHNSPPGAHFSMITHRLQYRHRFLDY